MSASEKKPIAKPAAAAPAAEKKPAGKPAIAPSDSHAADKSKPAAIAKDPAKAAQAIPAEQRQTVLKSLPSDSELAKALRAQLVQLIAPAENAAV